MTTRHFSPRGKVGVISFRTAPMWRWDLFLLLSQSLPLFLFPSLLPKVGQGLFKMHPITLNIYTSRRSNGGVVSYWRAAEKVFLEKRSSSMSIISLKLHIVDICLLQLLIVLALVAYTNFPGLNRIFLIFQLNIECVSIRELQLDTTKWSDPYSSFCLIKMVPVIEVGIVSGHRILHIHCRERAIQFIFR